MNEKLIRRLLRAAIWISVAGGLLGLSIEGLALFKATEAIDPAQRGQLLDTALTAAVFWIFLWFGLPAGAVAFWRFLAWPERVLALALPLLAVAGVAAALALRPA